MLKPERCVHRFPSLPFTWLAVVTTFPCKFSLVLFARNLYGWRNNPPAAASLFSVFAAASERAGGCGNPPVLHLLTNNFLGSVGLRSFHHGFPIHHRDFLLTRPCQTPPRCFTKLSTFGTSLSVSWFLFSQWPLTCSLRKTESFLKITVSLTNDMGYQGCRVVLVVVEDKIREVSIFSNYGCKAVIKVPSS